MADRQAALCQEQALEAALLKQATAAVWSAGGYGIGGVRGGGSVPENAVGHRTDNGDGTCPLGPHLGWLACEELVSVFRHSEDPLNQGPSAAAAASSDQVMRQQLPHQAGGGRSGDDAGRAGWGHEEEELIKHAVTRMGLNLVLPRSVHSGTTFKGGSPCGFCGLALSGVGVERPATTATTLGGVAAGGFSGTAGGDGEALAPAEETVEVVVNACGHGYHVRCVEEGLTAAHVRGGVGGGWGGAGAMCLSCPRCV